MERSARPDRNMSGQWMDMSGIGNFLSAQGWELADIACSLGTGNRHAVFLLARDGQRAVLKIHEAQSSGRRDSFAHELLMHQFYAEHARRHIPKILVADEKCRAFIFEYIEGLPVGGAMSSLADVEAMAAFLVETNQPDILDHARRLDIPWASEAGRSARDHWQCARGRVEALLVLPPGDQETLAMQEFLRAGVSPVLTAVKQESLPVAQACLSPSDFGFHNAFRQKDGSFCFLDFEHAGMDDPAKLGADFILQPEAPLDAVHVSTFLGCLGTEPPFFPSLARRVREILPAQKAKWVSIILNVFLQPSADQAMKAARLEKAKRYWAEPLPNMTQF